MNICQNSKLSPIFPFSINITQQVFIALENDKNGVENEGIFVPNSTSFALAKMCQKSRWSPFASAKVFFTLANLRPLNACDSSFASARVLLSKPEAFNFFNFSFASANLSLRLGEVMPLVQVLLSCSFFHFLCFLYFQSLQNSYISLV